MEKSNSFLNIFLKKNVLFDFLKPGSCILVKILNVQKKFVLVDGNLKSLSCIKTEEFLSEKINPSLLIGKYVKVLIESLDKGNGTSVCSRKNYFIKIFWNYLKFSLKNKCIVIGKLLNKIKGGFSVLLNKYKCFLPFSEIDKKILLNYFFYKNKNLKFNVINFNFRKKNIILSRKSLIYNFLYKRKIALINSLKSGYILKGIVKGLSSYGIYIDLGYLDGLILLKNINWGPYKYANEIVEINQSVEAKILKVDKIKNKVFLGIKQLYNNPWKSIYFNYKIGNIRYARVFRITNYNIYMVFEFGVFSFIKKTKLLKNYKDKEFSKKVKINDYVLVLINYINVKKKFIGFKIYHKKKRIRKVKKIIKIKKIIKFLPPLA